MPFSSRAWPSTFTRSSSRTPSSSAACAVATARSSASSLETILHARCTDRGARASRRVALHVHGDRIHGDVRRRRLHVHGKGGRVAAEALRADAEHVDRLAELALEPRALRVLAMRA